MNRISEKFKVRVRNDEANIIYALSYTKKIV